MGLSHDPGGVGVPREASPQSVRSEGTLVRQHVAATPVAEEVLLWSPPLRGWRKRLRRWFALFALGSVLGMLYATQNLLAPNLTAVAKEFRFSKYEKDEKLGGA